MRVRVLLFGPEADAAGASEVSVDVDETPTCAALRAHLARAVPALVPSLPGCRFALNGEFAPDSSAIGEGDEVALIGMVSGG